MILSYIRRLGPFLGLQMINFNIFRCSQKDDFGGSEYDVDILGGQCKTELFLGVISKHYEAFLKVKIQN